MTFWENALSSGIGAMIGAGAAFLFGIGMYYLTIKWHRKIQRVIIEKNLRKELEYNILYLNKILDKLRSIKDKILADDALMATEYFKYDGYHRYFINLYFQKGYLYDKLEVADVNVIESILQSMNLERGGGLNAIIDMWKKDLQQFKTNTHAFISLEIKNVESHINDINLIIGKIFRNKTKT